LGGEEYIQLGGGGGGGGGAVAASIQGVGLPGMKVEKPKRQRIRWSDVQRRNQLGKG
jgi:hypothetical protein